MGIRNRIQSDSQMLCIEVNEVSLITRKDALTVN